jgi:copper chaperone
MRKIGNLNKIYGENMKIILSTIAASLISFSALAAQVSLKIEGMSCGMCEGKITENLKKTGKCSNISVSAKEKKATFETSAELTDSEIKKAVSDAGYKVTEISRN